MNLRTFNLAYELANGCLNSSVDQPSAESGIRGPNVISATPQSSTLPPTSSGAQAAAVAEAELDRCMEVDATDDDRKFVLSCMQAYGAEGETDESDLPVCQQCHNVLDVLHGEFEKNPSERNHAEKPGVWTNVFSHLNTASYVSATSTNSAI